MRQWHVDPSVLCRRHLLGEHVEHHMFLGAFLKGKNLDGYMWKGLLIPRTLHSRHEELVAEMSRRGMNHRSPLDPDQCEEFRVNLESQWGDTHYVNSESNLEELARRCPRCERRQNGA